MKLMNIIKLLSVLLCIIVLFAACDNEEIESTAEVTTEATEAPTEEPTVESTETETEAPTEAPETDEPLLESVEGKLENFFEVLGEGTEVNELTTVEEIEGDVQSGFMGMLPVSDKLVVIKDSDIDTKNNVTDTYTVYNIESGETVLTLTNTYPHADYDDIIDYFAKEETIIIDNGDGTYSSEEYKVNYKAKDYTVFSTVVDGIDMIGVYTVEATPIDEAVREENPDACLYELTATLAYYDAYGTLIVDDSGFGVYAMEGTDETVAITFGSVIAYFDAETGALKKTTSLDDNHVQEVFKYETERFGYYPTRSTNIAGLGSVRFMDIVNKKTGETIRYHFDNAYEYYYVSYLHNGDVLIQYWNYVTEDDPYDYYSIWDGDIHYYYETKLVILSVDDGKETVIDKPAFYIQSLVTGAEFAEDADLGLYNKLEVTENARNVAYVNMINDGIISNTTELVVLDNDLSVLYTYERVIEEQVYYESDLGYIILANGDKLVEIEETGLWAAIVAADGTVRSYLKDGMRVIGEYVVDDNNIYDYDLKLICNYSKKNYQVINLFDECVFLEVDYSTGDAKYRLMTFTVENGNIVLSDLLDSDSTVHNVIKDDYAIFRDLETGKYTLYNENMTALLTTNGSMNVTEFEGGYLVSAYVGNEIAYYIVK